MKPELEAALNDVLTHWEGHIGTHHASCYVNHAHCLAGLVKHILEDS